MRRLKIAFGKLETPPRHLQGTELPAYSKVFQHIPTYSNVLFFWESYS
jgi:hypothetical protein